MFEKWAFLKGKQNLHGYCALQQPVIKPSFDVKSDETEIPFMLAKKLAERGFDAYYKFLINGYKDPETGADHHLVGADVKFTVENDIKTQRRIKSYIGVRHASGLPVHGQRTQGNFRKNKGKAAVKKKVTSIRK